MRLDPLVRLFCLAALVAFSAVASAQNRIVGGTVAPDGAYPWMVAVADRASGDQFCGGSLIASRWVLTAAHCVSDQTAGAVSAIIGRSNLASRDGETIAVSRIIVHPDYGRVEVPDVALLQLSRASSLQPVELVRPGSNAASPGTVATVVGWGRISEFGPFVNALREAKVPIISHAACARAYGSQVYEPLEICAGLTQGGQDSCQGDSGGPLFIAGAQGSQYRQAGVVSWGNGCARPGMPGVYARVSGVIDWIKQQTGNAIDGGSAGGTGGSGAGTGGGSGGTPQTMSTLAARFSVSCDGLTCVFDGVRSTPGDSDITEYVYDLGDGEWDFGRRVVRTYARPGNLVVTLFIIDEDGNEASLSKRFAINRNTVVDGTVADVWNGRLGPNEYIAVPSRYGKFFQAGPLNTLLNHGGRQNFDLLIQAKDNTTGRWRTIRRAATRNSSEEVTIDRIEAGYYRFYVIARDGSSGGYRVTARHR